MKTLITLFAILFLSTGLFAQKFIQEWYIQLPGLSSAEATAIITTSDDQLLIAGYSNTNSSNGSMFFMKTDTAGNVIRTTFSDDQYNWTYPMANRLIKDIDNNYVMIGYYSAYQKTYFTRLSPSGDILDAHVTPDDYWGGYDVEQTKDSGFLVSAYSNWNISLRKLDNSGIVEWDTTFVDTASDPIHGRLYGMAKVDDSTFVVTGSRNHLPGSGEDLDVLFTKIRVYDDSVRLLNFIVYEGENNDQGNDILTIPGDGGYIICGYEPNTDNPNATAGLIMRIDTAGNLIWKETYSTNFNSNTSFIRIHLNADNDILVLARTSMGSNDVTLLKYSLDGELLQKEHFDWGVNETAYDFTIDPDGKIFVAAGTWSLSHRDALLLKVKDICPMATPEASLDNEQPIPGTDVVVHVQNTGDAWSYSLLQINGEVTLGTYTGNGGTLDFTAAGLNNDDVSQGLVVSVIEQGVDCIKYSDTLYPEFICPVETPEASLVNATPNIGEDIVVRVISTNDAWEYSLIQVNGEVTLGKTMGNGGTYEFTAPGLTNDDVSAGLVVSAALPGFDECVEYSDTLYPEFVDGIEDIYQNSLTIAPNPAHNFITISDNEHKISKLAVYDIKGQLIIEEEFLSTHQNINISTLTEGIYLIRITYREGASVYRKIIKN